MAYQRQQTFVGVDALTPEVLEEYAANATKEDRKLHQHDGVKVGLTSSSDFQSSFLPASLIRMHQRLADSAAGSISLPCSVTCETVLMMADISGYTALSRSLCMLGPDGVDLLSVELNGFFHSLVTLVHANGGDIYKFAGDAIICFWTRHDEDDESIEDLLEASIACSFQLIQTEHPLMKVAEAVSSADSDLDISNVTLPDSLGLHCAVGVGNLEMAGIGSPPEFIANGAPFAQVEKALSASVRGELTVSTEVWDALGEDTKEAYKSSDAAEGVKKLKLIDEESVAEDRMLALKNPIDARKRLFDSVEPSMWDDLLRFEPPIIQKEGANDTDQRRPTHSEDASEHPHAFMITPQIRNVAIVFVNITPNEEVAPNLIALHPILSEMQATMHKHNAMMRQFLVDDKGIVLIAALGVPKYSHPDDVDRAVATALGMARTLENYRMGFSIGISSGMGFCGCVGNNTRQEYAIIGSTVNLSAKIMAKMIGQNLVHCDDVTRERTDPTKFTFTEKGSIAVKGFSAPVTIHEPQKKLWNMLRRQFTRNAVHEGLPSRMSSHKALEKLLSDAMGSGESNSDEILNVFLKPKGRLSAKKVIPVISAEEAAPANDKPNIAVFICGKRGLGRTQFVKHSIVHARRREYNIFWTKCISRSQPFSAVAEMLCHIFELTPYLNSEKHASTAWDFLDELISSAAGENAARVKSTLRWLLLQQTDDGQLIQSPKSKNAMDSARVGSNAPAEEVLRALSAMVAVALKRLKDKVKGAVVFIIVEEIQLIDGASLSLLSTMMQSVYDTRIVLIHTSTEGAPDVTTKFDLSVELHALTRADTAHLIRNEYDGPVDDETIDLVHASAGGSPYWIVELSKLTKRVGKDASQAMNAAGQFGLQKCILERYDNLTELQQDVLQSCAVMAAVGSGAISFGVILKLASSPAIVAAMIEKDILFSQGMENFIHVGVFDEHQSGSSHAKDTVDWNGEFHFNHPMVQHTIYEVIPRAERLLAHERVATAIVLEMLGSYELLHTQLETIARHFELGLCHEKFTMYLALTIKETLDRGNGSDLEALINPVLERIQNHHDRQHGYTELLKILENAKENHLRDSSHSASAAIPSADGKLLESAWNLKMEKVDALIEKVRQTIESVGCSSKENGHRSATPPNG